MSIFVTLLFILPSTPDVVCKWGEKSTLPPQASCGVPTRVRLPLKQGGKRFEFRRADNPNLSSYFHRRRDGRGPVKRFSNLINLYKVDLYLCPKDFENPKTLLFKMITSTGVKNIQCRLGKGGPQPNVVIPSMVTPAMGVMALQPGMKVAPVSIMKAATPAPSGNGSSVIRNIVPPPVFRPARVDPFARFLGFAAIIFGVVLLGVVALALFLMARRLKRLEATIHSDRTKTRPLKSEDS